MLDVCESVCMLPCAMHAGWRCFPCVRASGVRSESHNIRPRDRVLNKSNTMLCTGWCLRAPATLRRAKFHSGRYAKLGCPGAIPF